MPKYLFKIDRISAWILFIGILFYFISGFGMSKGIIDPAFSAKVHMDYLSYIILIVFVIHTSFAIHLAFKRWHIWKASGILALVVFFVLFISFFIYADKFYKPESNDSNNSSSLNNSNYSATTNANTNIDIKIDFNSSTNSTTKTNIQTFTLSDLAKYNGQNNMPAYVAVDGDVYDLSRTFQSGRHYSHLAGTELTNAFYSYHAKQVLSKYPVIGRLQV
ncbi:MAG: cytochrome b5 domain-containing protein [Patescibacteria group bacterium]